MTERTEKDNRAQLAFWDQALAIPEEEKKAIENAGEMGLEAFAPAEKILKAACTLGERKKVLDYGCGIGWAAVAAAKSGCADVTAADAAPNAVESTRFLAKLFGVEAQVHPVCIAGDWLKTVPPETYDGFFCSNVLDTVPPKTAEEIVREAARALTPDAEVLIGLNYWLSPEMAAEKGMTLTDSCMVYMGDVLRLVSRTDEEWEAIFAPYFTVESLTMFAWEGEPEEKRRLFRLRKKADGKE